MNAVNDRASWGLGMKAGTLVRRALPALVTLCEREGAEVTGRGKWLDATCPRCGKKHLRINAESSVGVCMKFGCEFKGDAISYYRELHRVGFIEAAQALGAWQDDDRNAPAKAPARPVERIRTAEPPEPFPHYARRLWDDSRELAGSVAADYLQQRCCVIPPVDGDLRFHPAAKHRRLRRAGAARPWHGCGDG